MFHLNNFRIPLLKSFLVFGIIYVVFLCVVISYRSYTKSSNKSRISKMNRRNELKYILQWNPSASFNPLGQGQIEFIRHGCEYHNCYVTDERDFLSDLTDFDAIIFSGSVLAENWNIPLPQTRSSRQKYIFAATESAHNYMICDSVFDRYFNWTWTYRLDSDIRWKYITIYNFKGHIVGPKIDMTWPQMDPIGEKMKSTLNGKTKVAAWFVSHCETLSKREQFVSDLKNEVEVKGYGWTIDVVGPCGSYDCPKSRESECFENLKRNYYFYLSLENSFAEDYVTEKLLNALNNNAVPIVFGAANYSRPSFGGHSKLYYILQWGPTTSPFDIMGQGQDEFIRHGCEYYNCFVTDNIDYFPSLTRFDAVAFSGKFIPDKWNLPQKRLETQKYIFAATESAHNYRICDSVYDGYFNWTWTYRLDSDVRWAYITIYDLDGHVVGPKVDMTWPLSLDPISDDLKTSLSSKNKVVAWFVSHCSTLSKREEFVGELQYELEIKGYNWTVDVYGPCGDYDCSRSREDECFEMLRRDYYFYFSFENSFAEDYVTEKLLNALNYDTVPVVFGGANYSRFLPPGSYLDARELGVTKLAEAMDAIHKNHTAYYDFFRWQNHFRYEHTIESDICNLCAAMNDEDALKRTTVYTDFRRWWNDKQWDWNDSNCPL